MSAPQVRSDYAKLRSAQRSFNAQADAVSKSIQQLKSSVDKLQGGDWIGEGARKFYEEMNGPVFKTLNNLHKALDASARDAATIARIMKAAEEQASSVFRI